MSTEGFTVGILGGMGPAATAEFLSEFTELTPAGCDQDHIPSVVLCDTGIPDRTEAILTGIDTVTPRLRRDAEQLASWGADLLAVPCNTAHFFLEPFAGELPIPLVSIIDATLDSLLRTGLVREKKGKNVPSTEANRSVDAWLACTRGTLSTCLYQKAAEKKGIRLGIPSSGMVSEFAAIIALVKEGNPHLAGQRWAKVNQRLREISDVPVLLACTELPLAAQAAQDDRGASRDGLGCREISSVTALAEAVIVACGRTPLSWRKRRNTLPSHKRQDAG